MGTFLGRIVGSNKSPSRYLKDVEKYRKYSIGEFTYGNPQIWDWNDGTDLTIGRFCSIADDVSIIIGGNHRKDWVSTFPFSAFNQDFPEAANIKGHPSSKGPIQIGNDVWIGHGVTILSGIKIGDGACIGAQTVISKDVKPYEIVIGNPQLSKGFRFSEQQIKSLLKINWWNWDLKKIKEHVPFLMSENIDDFILKHLPQNE